MTTYARLSRLFVILLSLAAAPVDAQTIDDGILVAKGSLFTGTLYTHESWDENWEGTLKRVNGNIGTITTRTGTWTGNYGISDRLNVIAMVPHVWTRASQGVLHGLRGFQDITLAGKVNVFEKRLAAGGALRTIAVAAASLPLTDYTPDFQPLSIGHGSTRVSWRLTSHFQSDPGWFVTGSTAYTWRSQVRLDRPYYFTEDRLFLTDTVDMPNAFDYVASAGYARRRLMATVSLTQQRMLGGGDIRRQDAPFVSNRMDFSRVGLMAMHQVPTLRDLWFQLSYAYTFSGRNVGQATTFTTGLLYRLGGRPTE